MISVCDAVLVVLLVITGPVLLVLKFTVTDVTHSGADVFQVTLTAGVGPFTLSAFTVTVESKN